MNILDENVPENQRQLLRSWRVPMRQIGYDVGRQGLKDREIIPLLLQLRRATFFSLDSDFYKRDLCHSKYCLVCMDDCWLEDVAVSGEVTRHGPVSATVQTPTAVTLSSLNASAGAVAGLPSLLVAAGVGLALGLSRLRWRT